MDKLIHVLDSHRLSIVFYSRVNNTPFSSLFVAPPLKSEYTASKLRMLRHMAELCRIVKLFQQKNIDLISLKGPLLGQLYYDDYTERECNDLDILVKPGDLETAYQVLLNLGYTLSETLWETPKQKSLYQKTFHHYHLYNQATDIQVELHWKLFTSTIEAENIEHTIWPNSIAHHISGLHISILSSSINFIYLCVHGSTHQWKRLFWVLDIVRIIEKEGQDFIVNAYEIALESHVERCVLEGCQLAHLLFKVDLPKPIQDAIQEDTQLSKLTETSIFFINTTTLPSLSPLSSLKAFRLTVKKVVYFHQAIYLLAGSKAIYTTVKKFFINPDYWRIYSVNDKLFALNYVIAPLLWIYCLFRKHRA
ncbi:nucleotidyltransferase domain-containing protein [Spirosoma rigui]|uniref:nucleotidyltransferase domain-containing protein n=1 Tax=Spirosoma rigui TaxID=564064 RepID=UPI001473DE9A|nr:nucleotidyltransferase family protein [Spirosoma rigui]